MYLIVEFPAPFISIDLFCDLHVILHDHQSEIKKTKGSKPGVVLVVSLNDI